MLDRNKEEDSRNKQDGADSTSEGDNLIDQIRSDMQDSFKDLRSQLNERLSGGSAPRPRRERSRGDTEFPWSSELDADDEVAGTAYTDKQSSTYETRPDEVPPIGRGRAADWLPPNWDQMTPSEQHCFLERLHFTKQVRLQDLIDLYPQADRLDADAALVDTESLPPQGKKVLGLFARASRTKKKRGAGTLTGTAFQEHMDSLNGDPTAFDPSTEEAFNTDARNLREYNTRINVARGADISEVRQAKRKKAQLLKAYEDLGRRQDPKRNYPHVNQSDYAKEILILKEAYRKGHRKAE